VREAVGPDVKLGVDANGGWGTFGNAVTVIGRLLQYNIAFVEQPVPAADILGMWGVRNDIPSVPIIADESVYTRQDAENLAELGACDVVSIYVGKAAGIAPALEIARYAQTLGLTSTVGSNLELGVGSAAMIHLALASRAIDAETFPCDIIGPLFYEDGILAEPLPIKGGEARVYAKPGLGVELDHEKVDKYRVK
jgi:muconate cycloisomerase